MNHLTSKPKTHGSIGRGQPVLDLTRLPVAMRPLHEPALTTAADGADTGHVPTPDPRFGVPRVLLVEDSLLQARVVAAQLEQGWGTPNTTVIASTLARAIGALERDTFNCVLLDLGLPDADGLEAVKRVRTTAPGVAIVVLSGQADETLALLAVREGAQDYLVKGRVDHSHIVRAISYAIERKQQEAVLVHQALYDGLTGLANRAQLLSRIEIAISRNHRHDESSAVIFLDLDGFKPVNDQYGHAVGDRVLIEVAHRLELIASLRSDLVARLGGDEFVILCEDTTAQGAEQIAGQIRSALTKPIDVGLESPLTVGMSVGVAIGAGSDATPDDLLHDADTAMYADKACRDTGRDRRIAVRDRGMAVRNDDLATRNPTRHPSRRRASRSTRVHPNQLDPSDWR
jgi:diguanylate cyclase (GGDEF)-like protein